MHNKQQLQECISECESALTHIINAIGKLEVPESMQSLIHAKKDLQECISACRSML
ncbi:hypothetical protein [Metabacillus arenae]|uniref:Uncharacterized protein n=1 Tax=Metabacillus arenae TaxID=2771434 RepID=A0A926RVF8_9BACI|nr:hypothetical protein [Metabacillus arenae]MBD1378781.1 hypothetical protein [Metabacillus arenae]